MTAKLNICSLGDPTNPQTWSGTPFNLYSELKKMDRLGIAFNSSALTNRPLKMLIRLIGKIWYLNSVDLLRGFERYFNAQKTVAETAKSGTGLTLHTGTYALPFFSLPKNQKHYLYCDSTWNLWSSFSTKMQGYSARLVKDAERLEKKAFHQMEHIFSISQYVKDNLVTQYGVSPEKITVAGTGLGVIKPYFGKKDYTNGKILFAAKGRFEDKGGSLVLKSFRKALESIPGLQLIIVGRNEYTGRIKEPGVTSYGFLPTEELQNLFNECSLFLMPAINEPWGLVYLEALACKMPVIGLNRNSFPEISSYGKYGFGLDDPDPDRLCEVLLEALSDPVKLEDIGKRGQEYCLDRYSWNKTVLRILDTIS